MEHAHLQSLAGARFRLESLRQADADDKELLPQIDLSTLFEIQQLVRAGISNAVRHGSATRAALAVATSGDNWLTLTLEDDGFGFDEKNGPVRPRSISERVAALDGTLAVDTFNSKTQLRISIPLKGGRCARL